MNETFNKRVSLRRDRKQKYESINESEEDIDGSPDFVSTYKSDSINSKVKSSNNYPSSIMHISTQNE